MKNKFKLLKMYGQDHYSPGFRNFVTERCLSQKEGDRRRQKKEETLSDIIGRATELPDQSRLLELSQEQNIDWSTHCIGCSWNGSFVTVGQLVGWKEQNSDW